MGYGSSPHPPDLDHLGLAASAARAPSPHRSLTCPSATHCFVSLDCRCERCESSAKEGGEQAGKGNKQGTARLGQRAGRGAGGAAEADHGVREEDIDRRKRKSEGAHHGVGEDGRAEAGVGLARTEE
eukprot:1435724-Rhodomonas_salina.3